MSAAVPGVRWIVSIGMAYYPKESAILIQFKVPNLTGKRNWSNDKETPKFQLKFN